MAIDLLVRSEVRPPYGDDVDRPVARPPGRRMRYCHKCGRSIGRMLLMPGSVVEIKCHSCKVIHVEVGE